MLTGKIVCCVSMFIFMLALGFGLNYAVLSRPPLNPAQGASMITEDFRIHSAAADSPVPLRMPFLPRQYVRVISANQ